MFLIMYKSNGLGLSANQIGLTDAVSVIDIVGDEKEDHQIILINPKIISSSGGVEMIEGCLSLPGINIPVTRAEKITVETFDLEGNVKTIEADGMLARAIQHEVDHLNGKLTIDRVHNVERIMLDGKLKRLTRDYKKLNRI